MHDALTVHHLSHSLKAQVLAGASLDQVRRRPVVVKRRVPIAWLGENTDLRLDLTCGAGPIDAGRDQATKMSGIDADLSLGGPLNPGATLSQLTSDDTVGHAKLSIKTTLVDDEDQVESSHYGTASASMSVGPWKPPWG